MVCVAVTSLCSTPLEARHGEIDGLSFFDTGPVRIRSQFLLGVGFLYLEPSSAAVIESDEWQIDLVQSVTNTWVGSNALERPIEARERREPVTLSELQGFTPGRAIYFADGELYITSLSIRRGLGHRLQLSVDVPLVNFRGGFMDQMIKEFHDSFGFDQGGRLDVPQDQYTVYFRDQEDRELFRTVAPSSGIGDVAIGLKGAFGAHSGRWHFAWEGMAQFPTGDEEDLYGNGETDFGVQLAAARFGHHHCLHLGVGAVYLGGSEAFHLDEELLLGGSIAWEHALGSSASFVAQVQVSESPFRDSGVEQLDDEQYLVDLALKRAFNDQAVFFFAVSENFVNFSNAADFGAHAGFTWTF